MNKLQVNIVELRKEHNLSQEALADKIGVSRQAVSKWERGETLPDLHNLELLSDLFSKSLDDLYNKSLDELVGKEVSQYQEPIKSDFEVKRKQFVSFITLLSLVSYLILGYAFQGWAYWMVLYLMIPLSYAGFTFFYKNK